MEIKKAGTYTVDFKAGHLSNGSYILRMFAKLSHGQEN
jgi:hypothetical protein